MKNKILIFFVLAFLLITTFSLVSASKNFEINSSAGTILFANGTSGNVGIGTATPQNKLNVIGDGNFTGTLYANGNRIDNLNSTGLIKDWNASGYIKNWNATGLIINWSNSIGLSGYVPYTGASSNLDLGTHNLTVGSTALFVNGNTGNVGIGTTSFPSVGDVLTIGPVPGSGTEGGQVGLLGAGSYNYVYIDNNYGNFRVISNTTSGEKLRLFINGSSGNVGIGTASPSHAKFEVYGTDGGAVAAFGNDNAANGGLDGALFISSNHTSKIATLYSGGSDSGLAFSTNNAGTTSERMRITSTGNVGIGTSSPNGLLTVNQGTLQLTGTSQIAPTSGTGLELFYDGTNGIVQSYARSGGAWEPLVFGGQNITLKTAGTSRMFIDSSGNVGIGTTNPATILDVLNTGGTGYIDYHAFDGSNSYLRAQLGSNSYNGELNLYDSNSAEQVHIASNGNSYINTGGKVGIGTATPQNTLNVVGDLNVTGTIYGAGGGVIGSSTIWNRSGSDVYLANSGDNVGIGTSSPDATLNLIMNKNGISSTGFHISETYAAGAGDLWIGVDNSTHYSYLQAHRWATGYASLSLNPNGGYVGIGTTNPNKELEVYSSSAGAHGILINTTSSTSNPKLTLSNPFNTWDLLMQYGATGGDLRFSQTSGGLSYPLTIQNGTGNVGIGTTSPATLLDVRDSTGSYLTLGKTSSFAAGQRSGIIIQEGSTQDANITWNADTNALNFYNNVGTHTILSMKGGNVGIGTTSPSHTLDVQSGTNAHFVVRPGSDFGAGYSGTAIDSVTDGSASRNMLVVAGNPIVMTGGNVGIGTTSPSHAKFEVYGTDGGAVAAFGNDNAANGGLDGALFISSNHTSKIATLYSGGSDSGLAFSTNNAGTTSERMRITSTGNVGIGTASPNYKLDISGGDLNVGGNDLYFNGNLRLSDSVSSSYTDFRPQGNRLILYDNSHSYVMQLYSAGTQAVQINSNGNTFFNGGNVGIGTSGPLSTLSVGGVGVSGAGIYGHGGSYGVYGYNSGSGNYGYLGGSSSGVYGYNSGNGNVGVLGGSSYGAYGNGNIGVYGTNGVIYGYLGSSSYGAYAQYNSNNYGYLGSSTTGVYGSGILYGVRGYNSNAGGYGVYGDGGSTGFGIYGKSTSNVGVYGTSGTGDGVYGFNSGSGNYGELGSSSYGVRGTSSSSSIGVYGTSSSGSGVYGTSSSGSGVYASSTSGDGVYASSTSGYGVYGINSSSGAYGYLGGKAEGVYGEGARGVVGYGISGPGVYGFTSGGYGVQGSSGTGYGGYFTSTSSLGVYASGGSQDITAVHGKYYLSTAPPASVGSAQLCWDGSGASGIGQCTSLRQYKNNITSLNLSLSDYMKLRPVSFYWNQNTSSQNIQGGFIAEEASAINPIFGEYNWNQTLNNSKLIGVNFEAVTAANTQVIQQQQKIIEQQNQTINQLNEKVNSLNSTIQKICSANGLKC